MRGEFLVTDKDIRRLKQRHGRARLLQIQDELGRYNDPVLGHVLERMWGVLFSGGNTTYYDPRHLRPMWRRAVESVGSFWSLGYYEKD